MPLDIDTSNLEVKEEYFMPSTIETIDGALTEYLKDLKIFTDTNEGRKSVPVIWTSAERTFQVKDNKDLRDSNGILIKPVITIERVGITKNLDDKGLIYANVPPVNDAQGGVVTIARKIKQDKTSNFANADALRRHKQKNFRTRKAKKVVYETITIPLPVYIQANYSVTLYSEYQQQINEMISPFITRPGNINAVSLRKDGHSYEAFINSDFTQNNNLAALSSEERKYETKISIKVIGYLVGDDKNQEQPKIVRRQNAVEVKIPRERVIYGDINDIIKGGFYKE